MNYFSPTSLTALWQNFSWLRPEWLWLLLPLILFAWWHLRRSKTASGWQQLIAPELLQVLLQQQDTASNAKRPRWPLLAAALALTVLALAGPSFSRQELNTLKLTDALVIVLDLSPSMLAEDVKPSRLQAAHFKILDLLAQRKEGYTALIAYSGSAHVVAPLSDDANTLAALVPSLEPSIMPSLGSRAEDAIDAAITLLDNAQFSGGRIVLFTDEVVTTAADHIVQRMGEHPAFELHVVGIGTEQGAPVPLNNGQFARDQQGNVVMNPLPWSDLETLAKKSGGYSYHLQRNPQAIDALAKAAIKHASNDKTESSVDLPQDHGYLLLPLITLFAALAFIQPAYLLRAFALVLLFSAILPAPVLAQLVEQHANTKTAEPAAADAANTKPITDSESTTDRKALWRDLWQTPNQQASRALAEGDAETAFQRFDDPQWKGVAAYQSQRFAEAEQLFSQDSSAQGLYNLANAQAQQGKFADAIANYQRALELNPELHDAQSNKTLVEALLKQQQAQQQDSQGQQGQEGQTGQQDQQDQNNAQQPADQAANADQSAEQNSPSDGSQSDNAQDSQSAADQSQNSAEPQAENNGAADNAQSSADQQSAAQANPNDDAADKPESQAANPTISEAQQRAEDAQAIAERAARAQQDNTDQTNTQQSASGMAELNDDAQETDANSQAVTPADNAQQPPTEEQQALEQQLRRVPDDPAGLLRNKFNYYYQLDRRNRQYDGRQQEQPRW